MKQHFPLLILALSLCITNLYAQQEEDKLVSLGIRAGVNLNNIAGNDFSGNKLSNDLKTGFHAGIKADLYVSEGFYLQPGLIYSTKGAEKKNDNNTRTQHLSYLELPIYVLFKPQVGTGRFLLGAGPYAAYGISGKNKVKSGGTALEQDAKFKNEITAIEYATTLLNAAYFIKPWDFGANMIIGYELNSGFSLQVNGQLGLSDINPVVKSVEADKSKWKNLGFGLSLGYSF